MRLPARLLAPASALYGAIAERRFRRAAPLRSPLPVICVGNFTAGGTGKTPLSRYLLDAFARRSVTSACLSRGYGGALAGPVWVDRTRHTARDVGDEPLLLARSGRVLIARDRRAGMLAIAGDGETGAVVMDDGLQNPALAKDLTIAVVDARRGLGNGLVIPSGPLRARLAFQLGLVDCVVVMGALDGGEDLPVLRSLRAKFPGPVLRAEARPTDASPDVTGRAVLAFAGIANPERFFRLVEGLGAECVLRRPFPDHHAFSEADARALLDEANALGARLVTTEKDEARLAGATGACGALARRLETVPIAVVFDQRDSLRLDALIDGALKSVRR